jgi:hypothetical protein
MNTHGKMSDPLSVLIGPNLLFRGRIPLEGVTLASNILHVVQDTPS